MVHSLGDILGPHPRACCRTNPGDVEVPWLSIWPQKHSTALAILTAVVALLQRLQQASRPAMDWGPSLEENRTGTYVATLAGSQSPKPLMVHMRKYGGITSFENTAIEVDREIAEEEESMM